MVKNMVELLQNVETGKYIVEILHIVVISEKYGGKFANYDTW